VYSVIRVMNTYAWIPATADSRIVKTIGISIDIAVAVAPISIRAFPNSDINKCPAIMFAVSRTHRVIGRMILLVISIKTMKFIKAIGVPCGSKCVSMCLYFFVHPYELIVNHIKRDMGRVNVKCALMENSWG